jgi:hypothetical protein
MGKVLIKWTIPITMVFLVICSIAIFKTVSSNNFYNRYIGMNLPDNSIILKKDDSHSGFHGDGEFYSEVQLTENGVKEFVQSANKTGVWHSYPLPKDIEVLLYGGEYMGVGYGIGKKSKSIPKDIQHGIYYIKDRLAERNPSMENTNILSRGAYGVTISILDFDTKKLYIYELDT